MNKRQSTDERLEEEYFEYNPEQDSNGGQGIATAEKVFKRCGYNFRTLDKWIMMHGISHLGKKACEKANSS